MVSFQLAGIASDAFEPLFSLSDAALAEHRAVRCIATDDFGFPCRVSLEDAPAGEELLLLPYWHQPAASPYHAAGPIYVRRQARRRVLSPGELGSYITRRLISVRGYDQSDLMVAAEVCEGTQAAAEIARQFGDERVRYIHLHNARRGCFFGQVERV